MLGHRVGDDRLHTLDRPCQRVLRAASRIPASRAPQARSMRPRDRGGNRAGVAGRPTRDIDLPEGARHERDSTAHDSTVPDPRRWGCPVRGGCGDRLRQGKVLGRPAHGRGRGSYRGGCRGRVLERRSHVLGRRRLHAGAGSVPLVLSIVARGHRDWPGVGSRSGLDGSRPGHRPGGGRRDRSGPVRGHGRAHHAGGHRRHAGFSRAERLPGAARINLGWFRAHAPDAGADRDLRQRDDHLGDRVKATL